MFTKESIESHARALYDRAGSRCHMRRQPLPKLELRARQRGAVLVWFALSFLALIGFIGVGVDVGRMYIVRNEAQSFADAAALAAAVELNGTTAGITAATAAARSNWGKYHFGSLTFPTPDVKYSTVSTGGWTATPPNPPTNYRFAQVTATVSSLPMYLMPIVTGQPNATVAAKAVAGQIQVGTGSGMFPMSPIAHSADANSGDGYGLVRGQKYTLRYGSNADKDTGSWCPGDQDPAFLNSMTVSGDIKQVPNRGYYSEGNGAQTLAGDIQYGVPLPLTLGTDLAPYFANQNGMKAGPAADAINARTGADGNQTVYSTYAAYSDPSTGYWATGGNGERLVYAPISKPPGTGITTVLSFGLFLLEPSYDKQPHTNWCAMYIGSALEWTDKPGAIPGLLSLRLVQ
jgi:Flp pilus assembly protein TadG